jgi:hypothetical protein
MRLKLEFLCGNKNSDMVVRLAILLWYIWHNCNDKIWKDNIKMSSQIGRQTFDTWNSWYSVDKVKCNCVIIAPKLAMLR